MNNFTCDELVLGKKARELCHVLGRPQSAERGLVPERREIFCGQPRVHRGVDHAGGNAVDLNAGGANLLGKCLGKADYPRFRR